MIGNDLVSRGVLNPVVVVTPEEVELRPIERVLGCWTLVPDGVAPLVCGDL